MTAPVKTPRYRSVRRWMTARLAATPRAGADPAGPVAIAKLDRLGDFVLATGAIRTLLDGFGADRCRLLVSPEAAELARREFPGTPLIVLPRAAGHGRALWAAWRHRRALGRLGAGLSVCLRHQRFDYDELVLSWLRAPHCVRTFDEGAGSSFRQWRSFAVDTRGLVQPGDWEGAVSPPAPWLCHELRLHQRVVGAALRRPVADEEILPALAGRSPRGRGGLVVTPFGSEPLRDLPPRLLQAGVKRAEELGIRRVVLTGLPSQAPALHRLAAGLQHSPAVEVVVGTQLSLPDYLQAVAGAELVLTADTATAHLAVAYDRPTVVAIGGGHFGQFGPWRRSRRQLWLTAVQPCFGCDWHCPHPTPLCLTEIGAGAVADAVSQVLAAADAP